MTEEVIGTSIIQLGRSVKKTNNAHGHIVGRITVRVVFSNDDL